MCISSFMSIAKKVVAFLSSHFLRDFGLLFLSICLCFMNNFCIFYVFSTKFGLLQWSVSEPTVCLLCQHLQLQSCYFQSLQHSRCCLRLLLYAPLMYHPWNSIGQMSLHCCCFRQISFIYALCDTCGICW